MDAANWQLNKCKKGASSGAGAVTQSLKTLEID